MSRSGYTEDMDDTWAHIRWRGAVKSAIRGKHGQSFLREMLAALDALPEKELHANVLVTDGEACALGAVAIKRNMDVSELDPEDHHAVCNAFNIADALGQEIMWENDCYPRETPERRFARVHAWVAGNILEVVPDQVPNEGGRTAEELTP